MDEAMRRIQKKVQTAVNPDHGDQASLAEPSQARDQTAASSFAAAGDEALSIPARLTLGETFRIDKGLVRRLRLREVNAKEAFTIRDASGDYFRASLKEWDERNGMALTYERMEGSPEPAIDITLACAVLARQRMHFVVQKATELGVRRIVPLLTDHSVPADGLAQEQAHAWAGHIARAARQCRRASLPELIAPMGLYNFLASTVFTAADLCLYLDDRGESAVPDPAPDPAGPKRIVLITGPEGGYSDAERAKLAGTAGAWGVGGGGLRARRAGVGGGARGWWRGG